MVFSSCFGGGSALAWDNWSMTDLKECPVFSTETGSPLLRCPQCGGDHVSPRGVVVRHRDHKGAPGLVVGVRGHAVSATHTEIQQSEGLEDSIDIAFVCHAGCGGSFVLQLQEDAGRTFAAWGSV